MMAELCGTALLLCVLYGSGGYWAITLLLFSLVGDAEGRSAYPPSPTKPPPHHHHGRKPSVQPLYLTSRYHVLLLLSLVGCSSS